MISSMTGFGQAAAEVDGVLYTVEIRSLNNRYLKAQLRMPDLAAFLEDDLDKLHRNLLHRGSVNFSLRMKNVSGQALIDIDEQALRTYMDRLTAMIQQDSAHFRVDLASLLSLPGIVQPMTPDLQTLEKMRHTVLRLAEEAIGRLKQSRLEEGKLLTEDLKTNCRFIREKLDIIRDRKDAVVQEYHQRLRKRAADLLAQAQLDMDEAILAREVAIFAERSDISEELIRLQTHLGQFVACLDEGGPAGRRLDFIAQELLREANTIASKASDATIAQCVIDIKCSVDRIKEQVQNIE
jgi:uncharacterized protein (TIGR00255 family)